MDLPIQRIQEILDGHRPTSLEIQLFREGLGADFNPSPTLMKKVTTRSDSSHKRIEALERHVGELRRQVAELQATLQKLLEQNQANLANANRRASS